MNNIESSHVLIRDARADDAAQILRFLHPFFEQELLLPRTEGELIKLTQHGFVAECNRQIDGFAAIEIYSRKLAEVQCLAVSHALRGQGIGKQLVTCCVNRARESGVLELMAITSSDSFLKTCGFDYSLPSQRRALFVHPGEMDNLPH